MLVQDVITPLRLVLISGLILNFCGDFILVGKLGMGISGASWATVFS